MKFNEITGLCSVEFTKLGNADKLLSLVGKEGRWDDETKEKFAKVMFEMCIRDRIYSDHYKRNRKILIRFLLLCHEISWIGFFREHLDNLLTIIDIREK